MSAEKRSVLEHLPKFLETLKHDVMTNDRKIFDTSFKLILSNALLQQRQKRGLENAASASDAKNAPKRSRKDNSGEELTDEAVLKALKRIGESNYTVSA